MFALGTNDPISDSSLFLTYIDRVMELAGNSTVVFVTPKTLDGENYSGVVSAMNNSREKYPNVRVANWDKLVEESNENYFAGDNVHLTSSGYSAWVDIICRQFVWRKVLFMNDQYLLEFDDGTSIETTIEGSFDYKDKEYVLLSDNKSEDLYIYRLIDNGGDDYILEEIDNEEELDEVSNELERLALEN